MFNIIFAQSRPQIRSLISLLAFLYISCYILSDIIGKWLCSIAAALRDVVLHRFFLHVSMVFIGKCGFVYHGDTKLKCHKCDNGIRCCQFCLSNTDAHYKLDCIWNISFCTSHKCFGLNDMALTCHISFSSEIYGNIICMQH